MHSHVILAYGAGNLLVEVLAAVVPGAVAAIVPSTAKFLATWAALQTR